MSTKPFIAARVEEFLDRRLEALFRALGWREQVIGYAGYGSSEFVRVLARVVLVPQWSRSQLGRATKEFVKRRGWRSFITAPCVRASVTFTLGERRVTVLSDRGGYLDHRITPHDFEPGWHSITAQTAQSRPSECPVLIVGDDTTFGLVSDIDDTILTTWLPRPMIAAWNSFVRDESNRQSIPGMARFYQRFLDTHPGAVMVYLSTGAWNTFHFLTRFIDEHHYPRGPLLLTDWGPTNTGWFRSGMEHKRTNLLRLAADFPRVRWLLVGDDGQHDPEIYAEFTRSHPTHVAAVAIRQLSPTEQVLAHGTNMPLDEPDESTKTDDTWVEAPDGRGLAAQLRPLLDERP
ncbi:App1 family protein [Micropruina sp.]|uniref:App1 family protein n=1 Tax=Micropruina sp. TaxID=2737536 RepID=UPI0039E63225